MGMELNEFVTKISNIQKKALRDALKAKLNEGYTIDELYVSFDTKTTRNKNGIKAVVTYEIKEKTDN